MSDAYTTLPEDLESITAPEAKCLEIRIGLEALTITPQAYAVLGEPDRVEILFGRLSRMLALRPVKAGGRAITPNGKTLRQINCPRLIATLNLAPAPARTTHRFGAQLVEGALLIGPLPEAQR